jgi:hypothetical protein
MQRRPAAALIYVYQAAQSATCNLLPRSETRPSSAFCSAPASHRTRSRWPLQRLRRRRRRWGRWYALPSRRGRLRRWRLRWPPPPLSAPTWRSSRSAASTGSNRAETCPCSSPSPARSPSSSPTGSCFFSETAFCLIF